MLTVHLYITESTHKENQYTAQTFYGTSGSVNYIVSNDQALTLNPMHPHPPKHCLRLWCKDN